MSFINVRASWLLHYFDVTAEGRGAAEYQLALMFGNMAGMASGRRVSGCLALLKWVLYGSCMYHKLVAYLSAYGLRKGLTRLVG